MSGTASPDEIARWVSQLRLDAFLESADGNAAHAARPYEWNEQLSAALFEVIASLEVLVRNAIHQQMRATTRDNALQSWLTDDHVLQPKQIENVHDVISRLRRAKKEPTEDRVVAGLYFSSWTQLVGNKYEELWRHRLHPAFPNAAFRRDIAAPLNRLQQLRNRAAHHQSLLSWDVPRSLTDAFDVLGKIDTNAAAWVRERERATQIWAARPAA